MRAFKMDENILLPATGVGTTIMYGMTGEQIVVWLWIILLLISIATKIPEFLKSHPWIFNSIKRVWEVLREKQNRR